MKNGIDTQPLVYTSLGGEYDGYIIDWATNPSKSQHGKWQGHYIATKSGEATLRASIANLFDNEADAQNETQRIAKAAVAEAVGKKL